MTPPPTATARITAKLDDRYGRTRSRGSRMASWIVTGVLVVAGTAYIGWISFGSGANAVDADATSFTITSEHSLSLAVRISAPPHSRIACALEAQDVEHGIVGFRVLERDPTPEHTQAFTVDIPTVAKATTGFVASCWIT